MKEAEAGTGLALRDAENIMLRSTEHMTIEQFDQRQALIRHVVAQMQEGVHYGIIPGTRDKSLWEPGAEYLRAAFQIQWAYEVEEKIEDFTNHDYRYRVRAFQVLSNGAPGPAWPAHAWSQEQKFAGGPGGRGMEKEMLPHNVMDRAVKRAFVALIRNVTGTTGYFKQSLDIGPEPGTTAEPDERHPWLITCPLENHGQEWFKTEKMREPAHRQGNDWCNQSVALKSLIDEWLARIAKEHGWERETFNKIIKDGYEGRTWSRLTPSQKIEFLQKTTPEPAPPEEELPFPSSSKEGPDDTEAPPFPDTPLGQLQREVFEAEMDWPDFEAKVLHMPWPEWVKLRGTIDTARTQWETWKEQQAKEAQP